MKDRISTILLCLAAPLIVIGGAVVFRQKQYAWISLCVAVLGCFPFFRSFEKKDAATGRLVIIAVLTALAIGGRIIFAPIPGFKPVAAIVVISGMYFGGEAGFMVGALAAVISNFYFMQGAWTPFQMLGWGLTGAAAGALSGVLKRSRIAVGVLAAVSGIGFSLIMDLCTVLWADGLFNIRRYVATVWTSLPFTVIYAVSNGVFLMIFQRPIGKILERIKTKYAL